MDVKGRLFKCRDCDFLYRTTNVIMQCPSGHSRIYFVCDVCNEASGSSVCEGCKYKPTNMDFCFGLDGAFFRGAKFAPNLNVKPGLEFYFTEFRCRQLESRIEQLEGLVRDLLDRIEFHPDGPEAEEAVKRVKDTLK
jgi:hypothetical protein